MPYSCRNAVIVRVYWDRICQKRAGLVFITNVMGRVSVVQQLYYETANVANLV